MAGAFPIEANGDFAGVIAPRYVQDDLVFWGSMDGGKTFQDGELLPGYSNKSDPTDVAFTGEDAFISANNPGLGFSDSKGFAGAGFTFSAATGTVEDSSLALVDGALVESYWTLGSKDKVHFLSWDPSGTNPVDESQWTGPTDVANGYGGELASSPNEASNDLFIATQEYTGKRKKPTAVRVRQLGESGFGSPVTLFNDKNTDLFAVGDIAQAPNGHVAVVWPGYEKKHGNLKLVMRAFTSATGKNFSDSGDVANLGGAYGIRNNAQLEYSNNGSGAFTFMNGSGLHLANLKPGK